MRPRKTNLKGMICAVLSGAMILASVAPASAATARATTMKLEKTEGTVTLKTQNGSARKISKGMRLYNGNTLATAKYSYAHISLDSTKAVKLDQSSSATLRQSGNQLELLVKSGKLFFDVSKKLSAKESMNVRTSTMVTGVRGTCGVVEYVNQNKSKLYLIEGQVTLGTGQNATVVQGGQTATVVLQPKQETGGSEQPGVEDKPGETEKPGETDKKMEQKIMVEKLTEKTIPPVALQEIVANPVLQEKIEKTTELKIEKIEEALEKFEKEEAERIEQEKAEQEKEEEKDQEEQDEKKEDETTSSSGGGSYTPGTPSTSAPTSVTLSGAVSAAAINAALQSYSMVTVAVSANVTADAIVETKVSLEEEVTVPSGKVLIMETGSISGSEKLKSGNGTLIDKGNIEGIVEKPLFSISGMVTKVYADKLNAQVADYLNELAKTSAITAAFQKAASVTSNISLSGSSNQLILDMSTYTLQIQSDTLTLGSNVSITSSSTDATVFLAGGNLVLQGTSTNANTVIKNRGGGTIIKQTAGIVTWSDIGLSVAGASSVETAIEGAKANGEVVKLPGWVTVKAGCAPIWDSNGNIITLKSVSSEFTSGTVTATELNLALSVHETVTVGPDAGAELVSNDTVTVPAQKTLNIQSAEKPIGNNQYSGGFYLNGGTLSLQDGATLNVSGVIGRSGTINVGETSGATVSVAAGATLSASLLTLKAKSVINNSGTVDVGTIETDGTVNITNNALIKTQEYINSGSSTGSYKGTSDSVLVNNTRISNGPSGLTLLAYANTSDTDSNGLQYFYADSLGSLMEDRIETIKTFSGVDALKNANVVWWHFEKSATVPSSTEITLSNFNADMGTNELQVAGTLTLSGAAIVTGEGGTTVRLKGGTLYLGEAGVETTYAEIKNSSTTGYAIARDSGTLNWNNKEFHIGAAGGLKYTLSGDGLAINQTTKYVNVPEYVILVTDGAIDWNDSRNELRYVPWNFMNISEKVGQSQIEYSLGANSTMTIGPGVVTNLNAGESVTISEGKTLIIQTEKFTMAEGSKIILKENAKLIIEGVLSGTGTVDATAAGATVSVTGSIAETVTVNRGTGI